MKKAACRITPWRQEKGKTVRSLAIRGDKILCETSRLKAAEDRKKTGVNLGKRRAGQKVGGSRVSASGGQARGKLRDLQCTKDLIS